VLAALAALVGGFGIVAGAVGYGAAGAATGDLTFFEFAAAAAGLCAVL